MAPFLLGLVDCKPIKPQELEPFQFQLTLAHTPLYVEEGILDRKYVEQFDVTMLLRETADYKRDFSKEGAGLALKNAEEFMVETERILTLGSI